jgi:hypothetical protein
MMAGATTDDRTRQVSWLTAFLDFESEHFSAGVAFWAAVTGFDVSRVRGDLDEFVSFLPPAGDDYLRAQRLGVGNTRVHVDLTVPEPRASADVAIAAGAAEIADVGEYVVLRSPGGLVFCFVSHGGAIRPDPSTWTDGQRSGVYQVCLDLPAEGYAAEAKFWAETLGAHPEVLVARPEFSWLRMDRQLALDVLLQRLDTPLGVVSAHLDLGTSDRGAEVERHLGHGAELLATEEFWSVLRDPTGMVYCITDRDPATGRLVAAHKAVARSNSLKS